MKAKILSVNIKNKLLGTTVLIIKRSFHKFHLLWREFHVTCWAHMLPNSKLQSMIVLTTVEHIPRVKTLLLTLRETLQGRRHKHPVALEGMEGQKV